MTYYEGQELHDEKCERCEHHGASGDGGKKMSNENQETIADIVKEMRDLGRLDEKSTDKIQRSLQALGLRTYADRIEAAAKRERESGAEAAQVCGEIGEMIGREAARRSDERTAEKYSAVGNAAAMLEALEAVVKVGYPHNFQKEAPHIRGYCCEITTAIKKCFDALSAPPRNCDVGTAGEQVERHIKLCKGYKCVPGTPCYVCFAKWAQMPYEK